MKLYWKALFVGFCWKGTEWLQRKFFIYNTLALKDPLTSRRHKNILGEKKKLTLLPFLCHLFPTIIRNTSSNLIMLSALLKNFPSILLPFILTLGDWEQLSQTTAAALPRMQHRGCSSLTPFTRVHKSLHTQRRAYTHGGRCRFANHALHPQKSRDPLFLGRQPKMAAHD